MEIGDIEIKDLIFDIRTVMKNRVGAHFETNRKIRTIIKNGRSIQTSAFQTNFDVYHMELYVPLNLPIAKGIFTLFLNKDPIYQDDLQVRGRKVLKLKYVIDAGSMFSATLEYENAETLGHYTFQLRLESR